jgi:hypothetical protein
MVASISTKSLVEFPCGVNNTRSYSGRKGSGFWVRGSGKKQLPGSDRRRLQSSVREDGETPGASSRGFPEPLNPEPRVVADTQEYGENAGVGARAAALASARRFTPSADSGSRGRRKAAPGRRASIPSSARSRPDRRPGCRPGPPRARLPPSGDRAPSPRPAGAR